LSTDLDRLGKAYRRLAADTGSRIDFANDADSDALRAIAEEEKSYLDQAFFVLMFGVLEKQVSLLAVARTAGVERRMAMRRAAFEKRLDVAIKVASEVRPGGAAEEAANAKDLFLDWYGIRNDIAHGEPSTELLDLVGLLHRAKAMSALLGDVQRALVAR
jgi:hypothetical protein